jgi:hypothetical protein
VGFRNVERNDNSIRRHYATTTAFIFNFNTLK